MNRIFAALHKKSRRQAGMAAGEVIVLLVPLCVLCMAGASRLAATSSARLRGQWEVAARAQRDARVPCGGRAQRRQVTPVPGYLYRSTADREFADGVTGVRTEGAFDCNEPGDPGDRTRSARARAIEAATMLEARRLLGAGGRP